MGKSKRYHKSNKNEEDEQEQEERRLKLLEQKKESGRLPIAQPGYFHDSDEKQKKKVRKEEKTRLKNLIKELNHG